MRISDWSSDVCSSDLGPGRCLDMLGDDRRAVDDRGHHHGRRIPAIAVTIAIVLIEAARVRAPRIGAAIILAAARPPLLTCPAIPLAAAGGTGKRSDTAADHPAGGAFLLARVAVPGAGTLKRSAETLIGDSGCMNK